MGEDRDGAVSQATGPEKLVKGLVGIAVVLIPVLLPDALTPLQLDPLRAFGTGVGFVAAAVGLVFRPLHRSVLKIIVILAAITAIGAVVLFIGFLDTVPVAAGEERPVLVGFQITEDGRAEIERAGLIHESRSEIISRLGYDRVPAIWGWSYYVVLWGLTACLLALIASVTIVIVSIEDRHQHTSV